MGYTTDFNGQFDLDRPLAPEHREYLKRFAETRRMKRDADKAATRPDPLRVAVDLPIGKEGGYFVNGEGFRGQENFASDVLDGNYPPEDQPGLWCQWIPNEDGTAIEWDGVEKFYSYVEWLEYLVEHFIGPWGYQLNGSVDWEGEESGDMGTIWVKDNQIEAIATQLHNPGPSWDKQA